MKSYILRRIAILLNQLDRFKSYLDVYDSLITSKQTLFITTYDKLVEQSFCTLENEQDLQCFQCPYFNQVPNLLLFQLELVTLYKEKEDILIQIKNALSNYQLQLAHFTDYAQNKRKILLSCLNQDAQFYDSFSFKNSYQSFESLSSKNISQSFLCSLQSYEQNINDYGMIKRRKIDIDSFQTQSFIQKQSQSSSLSFVSQSQRLN